MTRKETVALRDNLFESMARQLPAPGVGGQELQVDLNFLSLMAMAHVACCKQLDSLIDHDVIVWDAQELLGIASRIEKSLPDTDAWANTIRAELGRLRKIAFGANLNGTPKEKS